jgi:hypothetical protein
MACLQDRGAFGQGLTATCGEDAGQQGADDAADAVDAPGVEAVVVLQRVLEPDGAGVAGRTRDDADEEGALGVDESGRRGDGDQTGDDAGEQAQQGRLLLLDPFDGQPAERGGTAARMVLKQAVPARRRRRPPSRR